MNFFKWFTTSEKAVDTGLDLIKDASSGIDMLFHTEEEKAIESAQARNELFAHALKMNELFNKSNTASSQARRYLAKVIVWFTFGIAIYCIGIMTYGYFSSPVVVDGVAMPAKLALSKQLTADIIVILSKLWIGEAFAAVVTTFFISHGAYKAVSK